MIAPEEGSVFSERMLGGPGPTRRVMRLGASVSLGDLPTIPPRYRSALGGPQGRLAGARLRTRTGEIWCRLSARRLWTRTVRMVPLNSSQPPAPTPDALELRRGARVDCQAGYIGRLEGVVVDVHTGLATELLVRVRRGIDGDVRGPRDPLAPLVPVQGLRVLVSPTWATKADQPSAALPFLPAQPRLMLNATAAQVAHGLMLRDDAELAADVWTILSVNPAVEPSLARMRVLVSDGTVTLLGSVPSLRHRLSAEQDVWHVPGVLAVHNELRIG